MIAPSTLWRDSAWQWGASLPSYFVIGRAPGPEAGETASWGPEHTMNKREKKVSVHARTSRVALRGVIPCQTL